MADEGKKKRGRPAAPATPTATEEKKSPAPPTKVAKKSDAEPAAPVVAAKRGRGRPPKGSKKKSTPYVKKGDSKGRGRPPKKTDST